MRQIKEVISKVIMGTGWPFIFIALLLGGHCAILNCLYLWHNALLYIITPFVMLILSIIISQSFKKKTAIASMFIVNCIVIAISCTYFVEMRESWEYLDEPEINEYFMSNMKYYILAMIAFMIFGFKEAIYWVAKCPKCGEWNTTEVLKKIYKGSYNTTCRVRNDKKVYDNTGKQIGSIENYDTKDVSRAYGHYLCKCTNCNNKWEEKF